MGHLQMTISRLDISDNKKRVLKNIFWSVIGKIITLLGGLLVGIFVARYLGPERYGLMNYVISLVSIFTIIAQFGFDLIEIREEARRPKLRDIIIGTFFYLRLFLAITTMALVVLYVFSYETDAYVRNLILIYALSIILSTFNVTRNYFTAIVWNEYIVKTEIIRTIVGVFVKISLVLCEASLTWFIGALVFDSILLASGYAFSYKKYISSFQQWRFNRRVAQYAMSQSFPLLLSGAAIIIYQRIDQIMISSMIDNARLGIYSVAVRFAEILVFVPTMIAQTIAPVLVETRQIDVQRYETQSRIFMNVTVYACIMLAVLTCILAYPVIYYTFGKVYIGAASILSILAFKVVGDALSQTSGQLIIIEGIQKYASIRNIIGCIACILLNLFFITNYGIHGAAYVAVITIFISGTFSNLIIPSYRRIFYKQILAITIGWKDIINIKKLLR